MPKQYDNMGQAIYVGDVITHATGSGHAMNVSAGVVTGVSAAGIHATVVDTVYHGERNPSGESVLRKTFYKDGKYTTLTGLDKWDFEMRFDVTLPAIPYQPDEDLTPEQLLQIAKTREANRLIPQIWAKRIEAELHKKLPLFEASASLDFEY